MTIATTMFVDHQDVIGYPISITTSNLGFADEIFIFGSDERNLELAKAGLHDSPHLAKMQFAVVDCKITRPGDISAAQNRSYEYVLDHTDHDLILVLQASRMLTDQGVSLITSDYVINEVINSDVPYCMTVFHTFLFHQWYQSVNGAALFNRTTKVRYDEIGNDGAYPEAYKMIDNPHIPRSDGTAIRDIGHYSPSMHYRKLLQHSHTWGLMADWLV